ncbi:Fanconi anemia group M protein isoform X2 [Oryzias latipes]|uniref:Fanconi anemia group M protein isoform X2 n=1 Tax=Oryzias latipes TaxID=8090 RepID=UPI0005CBB164|nr:Fanconi anemia group M protein isoform X2 [Oryzias latipes]
MKMSGGTNQRTLFQTWGASVSQNKTIQPPQNGKKASEVSRPRPPSSKTAKVATTPRASLWTEFGHTSENSGKTEDILQENEDDDDELMVVAVYEAEKSLQLGNRLEVDSCVAVDDEATLPPPSSATQTYPDFPDFDSSSAKVWIYPTNYPIRNYQLKISEAALFQNTLVCLPTGLGKTFIASVVMYNFYRWYPSGKIVFMAPTKPLVAQQIEACYKVMGIPQTHMAELTGSTAAKQRQDVWRSKRVFFLTPQVMVNDLSRDTCPAKQVKCVVIDEAHKALGNHAYCQVIRQLSSQTLQFRVLALSATPGGDAKSVQAVISNLLISHIELRSEESLDIQAHSHQRSVDKVVVPLGEALSAYQTRYLEVLKKFMSRLVQNRVMSQKDLRSLSKYQLILARDQFRKNPPPHIKSPQQGMLEGDFALCISLYHGYELLMQMGLRSLFFYVQGIMDGSREMSRTKNELQRTPTFMDLYHEMEAMFVKPSAGPDAPFVYSHPKLKKLEEVVLQHFRVWAESNSDNHGPQGVSTRVMIFSSFRESVQEIAAMLNRHSPLIRVMTFMGQASAGKGVKGFTQKEQLEVVQRFRQGGFNTLVSTCVGEEGLDIGEVDLIVCFDAQKNPIRLVQRMGRTGRKRQGRIVVVLAEGREERTYNQSQSNKRSVYKSITGNKNGFHMYHNSPRMLPEGLNPSLHKMYITCGQFDHRESSRRSGRGRRSHSEGRGSLIHPQSLIQHRSTASDGFLSSVEYSVWETTMKLGEHEAKPILKESHFLSIPSDPPPQENADKHKHPHRELSLWEWRHWQHKALPSHLVDHSLRCRHFVQVMELIDGMKDENEGECLYEQELLPYHHREDTEKRELRRGKAAKMRVKSTDNKTKSSGSSWSELLDIRDEVEEGSVDTLPTHAGRKPLLPVGPHSVDPCDDFKLDGAYRPPSSVDGEDCVIINAKKAEETCRDPVCLDHSPKRMANDDEEVELQGMFYLPQWDSPQLTCSDKPGKDETLKVILANVAELLCRSPPSLADISDAELMPPSPKPLHPPFFVSFSLDVDDDDDELICEANVATFGQNKTLALEEIGEKAAGVSACSPTWDEVFEDQVTFVDNITDDDIKQTHTRAIGNEEGGMNEENGSREMRSDEVLLNVTDDADGASQMDESMELFEDDKAFLQMTIPDIPTPPEGNVRYAEPLQMQDPTNSCRTSPLPESTHRLSRVETKDAASTEQRTSAFVAEGRRDYAKTPVGNDLISHSPNKTPDYLKCLPMQKTPEPLKISNDLFSVNFDLGLSLESSGDEAEVDAAPAPHATASPPPEKQMSLPSVSDSSTPYNSLSRLCSESRSSKPQRPLGKEALLSPITPTRPRQALTPGSLKRKRTEVMDSPPQPESDSGSEDDVVLHKRKIRNKVNPLSSPDVSKMSSDVDSPLVVRRKWISALNTSDVTKDEADDDFQNESRLTRRPSAPGAGRQRVRPAKHKTRVALKGRQFLDEEAELSEDEEGAGVSSDEEDGEDQNRSLDGFVVDNTHYSQELNDSEMQGVYLKSVRSPAVQGKFKMSYRNQNNMDIFSQVPEMDETYAEDSFVVGSDVEELDSDEEEDEGVELLPEASYVGGRRQYATRRRVFLHRAKAAAAEAQMESPPRQRTTTGSKRSRVIRVQDSSEDEQEEREETGLIIGGSAVPLLPNGTQKEPSVQKASSSASSTIASKVSLLRKAQKSSPSEEQQNQRRQQRIESQHLLSDELDFVSKVPFSSPKQSQAHTAALPEPQASSSTDSPAPPPSVSILVDSRCIGGAVELLTSLRQRHAATVLVCSLDASYFIVSNRMAVEKHGQSDLAAMQNRKRLAERVNSLQRLFERVCLIVEKDRTKAGEASRPFQRTHYYDRTLAALVRSGIRLLWSDGAEETAALLVDLAKLEHRKGHGITVPLEVKGQHREQALQLYSSLPSVNYAQALNLSHNFRSIAQLVNSSVESIQKGGCMSGTRAEEIFRFLRYSCDSSLIKTSKAGKNS